MKNQAKKNSNKKSEPKKEATSPTKKNPYIPLTRNPRPLYKSHLYNSFLKLCLTNKKDSFTIHDNISNRIALQSKAYEEHLKQQEIMKNAEIGVTKNKFSDPKFKAGLSSLSKIQQKYPVRLQWVRLSDIYSDLDDELIEEEIHNFSNFKLTMPILTVKNMFQDLTIPSVLSCISTQPSILNRFMENYKTANLGIYKGFVYSNSQWKSITVDDFVPMWSVNQGVLRDILMNVEEVGILCKIIEKILAKHFGGYEKIPFTTPENILRTLTGGDISVQEIPDNMFDKINCVAKIWSQLQNSLHSGSIVSLKSRKGVKPKQGLTLNHNYSLVKAVEVILDEVTGEKELLCLVRSCYSKDSWKGEWSYSSPRWNKHTKNAILKKDLFKRRYFGYLEEADPFIRVAEINKGKKADLSGLNFKEYFDGDFWMSFKDLLYYFERIITCDVQTGVSFYKKELEVESKKNIVRKAIKLRMTQFHNCSLSIEKVYSKWKKEQKRSNEVLKILIGKLKKNSFEYYGYASSENSKFTHLSCKHLVPGDYYILVEAINVKNKVRKLNLSIQTKGPIEIGILDEECQYWDRLWFKTWQDYTEKIYCDNYQNYARFDDYGRRIQNSCLGDFCDDIANFKVNVDGENDDFIINLKKFNAPNSSIYVFENPNYKAVALRINFENKNENEMRIFGDDSLVSYVHEVKILPKGISTFVLRYCDIENKCLNEENMKFGVNITGLSCYKSPSFEIMRIKFGSNPLKGEDRAISKEISSLVFKKECSYDDRFRGEEFECLVDLKELEQNVGKTQELRSEITTVVNTRRGSMASPVPQHKYGGSNRKVILFFNFIFLV